MLNEERVKHMTHMAMFENKEEKKLQPAMRYSKKDYINLCMIVSIFLGTVLYLLLCFAVFSILYATVFINLRSFGLILGAVLGLLLYVVFIFLYLKGARKRFAKHYEDSVVVVKELRKQYHTLEKMYENEESERTPEGWY